jgi:hypothetical protein
VLTVSIDPTSTKGYGLVSPFMPFNTTTKTTDIMMFNSRNLGALIVDQEPHVNEWEEPQFGIRNIGIEEKYGFGVLNEGQAIAVAKNIRRTLQREMSTPAGARSSRGSENTTYESAEGLGRSNPAECQRGSPLGPRRWLRQRLITQ